ncbi:hypothetical protein AVEN_8858-1, partial [Araneus ventricosus]
CEDGYPTHGCRPTLLGGSNSGPLLWLLIANDALRFEFDEDVKILAYADDFYLFLAASGKHTIQNKVRAALANLEQWSQSAKVQFAHSKTQLIPFGKKGRLKHPRTAPSPATLSS